MQHRKTLTLIGRLLALSLVVAALAACGARTKIEPPPTSVAVAPTVAPTQAPPTATSAPTATPVPPTPTAEPTATATLTPTVMVELPEGSATPAPAPAALSDFPIATDATDLTYDAEAGSVNYTSASDVQTLVDFYRAELPKQGWQEDEMMALVSDSIGSIDFAKGDATLNVTILGIGDSTDVTIAASGLSTGQVVMADVTPAAGGASGEPLTAEDKDGLPVPSDYTEYSSEGSPFRQSLNAVSPSALPAVLALYRSELAARQWQEAPGTVAPTAVEANLTFTNPDQDQLVLALAANADGGTNITAAVRMEAAAKEAGIIAPAGKARIYFGNVTDGEVTFNINQKDVKVGVQQPTQSMEGVPFVDLAPGKYDFTLTVAGGSPAKDSVEAKAGETWALVAGPGGALPLQMY